MRLRRDDPSGSPMTPLLTARVCSALLVLNLSCGLDAQAQTADPPYKLGDRLQQPARPAARAPAPVEYVETRWDDLIAPGWNPAEIIRKLQFGVLSDADPRAMEALQKMKQEWDQAPANPTMNGAAIRIAGFVVPLDSPGGAQKQFLLVPYFGACIHTPPPPANQIIHVLSTKPLKDLAAMNAVWVNGIVEVSKSDTAMATTSYRMRLASVEPYKRPESAPAR
jgi:hypothetical protein